jgi:hypothetical protein
VHQDDATVARFAELEGVVELRPVSDLDRAELLAEHDAQLRGRMPERLAEGARVERDGPLLRFTGLGPDGFVGYRDLDGCAGAELDALIERQVRFFAEREQRFEWKLYAHDRPADLAAHLSAAGFVPENEETVLVARVAGVAAEPRLPAGVVLREVAERGDLDRIAAMESTISQEDRSWLAESLEAERAADPQALRVMVAEAGSELVCAGWVRFEPGSEFASLWGGGTLPGWRRRGIYRAIVAGRANLALARGFRYLQVDASDESRPILERLGFVAVTTTTPFIWSPPARR